MFLSTKTYGHELGLSACFRQHKATHSHCSKLHGYALAFKFTFAAKELDATNWVQDFGGLKSLKEGLQRHFDHKLVVASDDPKLDEIVALHHKGVADVLIFPTVGCEAFARIAFSIAAELVNNDRVKVVQCECSEHGGNSAIYMPEDARAWLASGGFRDA